MAKHILLVDDDEEDLATMKNILEKEGYAITMVTNGAEALDKLTGDHFALVLVDIKMPTLSGYELLRLMREKINHKSMMIYVSIVPEKEVNMSGVDGFIQKPFSPEDFIGAIKKALKE